MSEFKFDEENEKKFQKLIQKYPKIDSLTLPSLWLIQEQEGWISLDAMKYIASRLGKSAADIYSIATFYTMFKLKPTGKYHICICKTASCKLCGSGNIKEKLEQKLGIKPGETTKDGKFTIEEVECLGACADAPVMSLNDKYIGQLSIEKIEKIINELE